MRSEDANDEAGFQEKKRSERALTPWKGTCHLCLVSRELHSEFTEDRGPIQTREPVVLHRHSDSLASSL